jgi:hypothetical protein
MRKLLIGIAGAVALLLAGMLVWNAEALTGTTTSRPTPNFSLVEQIGCRFPGICPAGQRVMNGKCIPCTPTCNGCPCYIKVGTGWRRVC